MSEVYWQPGVKISDVEKQVIIAAMKFYKENKTTAAASLGISVKTLYNKLDEYKVEDEELQRRTERVKSHQQASFLAIQSQNRGLSVQPTTQAPAELPMPMQQRKEIQEVPQASFARTSQNKK